ncbi:ATP-dependent endonuclease, partial [bacterium]|nr:ATP-dependent endonuclease [bacterium]
MDGDNDKDVQAIINDFIQANKNGYTREIYSFASDIEEFLGIAKPKKCRNDRKPLNVLSSYNNNLI